MHRILVVDDEIEILEVVQIILKLKGYDTMVSSKGEETLQNVKSYLPDLILLDVHIGLTNGINICRQLKSNSNTDKLPIIMFSAHFDKQEVTSSCTANEFIGKPFDIHKLTDMIHSQLILQ